VRVYVNQTLCTLCGVFHGCNAAMLIIPCVICFQCMVQEIPGVATISRLLKNYRSLLQNIVSFIGLLCKRDL